MNINDSFSLFHTNKSFAGDPPGTIKYTGAFADVPTEIERIVYNESGVSSDKTDTIDTHFETDKTYWYNVTGLNNADLIKQIGEIFDIHNMDMEDVVHVSQWSKIEDNGQYLFSIFKMIYLKDQELIHEHLSVILNKNVMITFQEIPGDVFGEVRKRIVENKGRIRTMGSDYLYYSIVDALVDQYFEVMNTFSTKFKDVELNVLENDKKGRAALYRLRKELVYLDNSISPLKDSLKSLSNKDSRFLDAATAPYYKDLLEHISQINDALKAYKEMLNSLHEMHMSNVNNDMNKTMMLLTIFSAIFIPLSFLAGVFGMNFKYMPGLEIRASFYVFISACIVIAGGMIAFFKMKKWF